MPTPNRNIVIHTGYQTIVITVEHDFGAGEPYGYVTVTAEPGAPESVSCGRADWYYQSSPVGRIVFETGHGFMLMQEQALAAAIYNLVGLHKLDY